MAPLSNAGIRRLCERLNAELRRIDVVGEVFLVGGAVMCLVHEARPSTQNIDAVFRSADAVREAARRTGLARGIGVHWLNHAVKGFMSERGDFAPCLELDHLRVMTAQRQYLLAMKCLAMRIGAEFHGEENVRFRPRLREVRSYEQAVRTITKDYPLDGFPQETRYALQDLRPKRTH